MDTKNQTKTKFSHSGHGHKNTTAFNKGKFFIRSVEPEDRPHLANLIHFEPNVHRHLEWRPPLDWIGHTPFLTAERDGVLYSALACPPDTPDVSWIRLFAVSSKWGSGPAWKTLWPVAQAELHTRRISKVAAIPLQKWFQNLLEESHFQQIHNVILLVWSPGKKPPGVKHTDFIVRPMVFDDISGIEEVDAQAFSSLWRNSQETLALAFQQSAVATVADQEGHIMGYQISTGSPMGGHLARLAVSPQYQGRGVGFALVRDAIDQFERRGAQRVTVNTQQDNAISLALYQKAGFRQTSEVYPVYQFRPMKHISREI
jgi:[ribosomal protein S18]-alanine N-acetyltransferase